MAEEAIEWLPVVEFDGAEFVVDVANRVFRERCDPDRSVGFHSEHGREMVRAMVGTEWQMWTPRDIVEKKAVVASESRSSCERS